jgi:uncharacterized tellurite resistance protein B-like protein
MSTDLKMQLLAELFYLISSADAVLDIRELKMGNAMLRLENISPQEFNELLNELSGEERATIYRRMVQRLEGATREDQLIALAWMKIISLSDGYVHEKETELIMKVAAEEVGIDSRKILEKQAVLMERLPD